ncbi:hypothetical protein BX661DRAFT_187176 [Kickxella alabastrina]|uniref:uncharacterized protein n=1 Tax=Kickxella alabastrina TaxID=61397 RepID=UPI0022207246|nr:uncharacterized protein BX661DRAFT_187176 [Kickxella alabastrina]KAI7822793.1 hypothetical protein BX661DRAFT_187176 [Kickxella alabastrina]KAJ1941034.1 hypothetical protein GGF37_003729 [Kickxella alabastrina]
MKGFQLVRDVVIKHKIQAITDMKQSLLLLDHMKKFGTVTSFRFSRDPLTKERTGMAFVSYLHSDDAKEALSNRRQIVEGLRAPLNNIEVSVHIRQPTTK